MGFDFGRALTRTFTPLKNNPVTFFGLSLLLVGLPGVVLAYYQQQATLEMMVGAQDLDPEADDPFAALSGLGRYLAALGLGALVGIVTTALLQGALIHAAVADYRGGRASIGASLSTGLRNLLPIVAISILLGLGLTLGFVFLVIPGIYLLVKWIVAIPAQVAEGAGVFGSFGRSFALTKGSWWPIFGLLVLYLVLANVVQGALSIPLGTSGAYTGADPEAMLEAASSPLALAIAGLVATVNGAVAAAGVAAIYYELREQRDGVGATDLAEVFA